MTTAALRAVPQEARFRGLFTYLTIACLGMWVAMSPLLLGGFRRTDGRTEPGIQEQLCIAGAMMAPALAAIVVVRWVERRDGRLLDALALRMPRPWSHAVRWMLAAVAVPAGLTAVALAIGTAAGVYPFGGVNWGDTTAWAGTALVQMLVSLPLFFGEELGWQGYLLPRLAYGKGRARPVRAYLGTGAAFALWHLPTLLMGGQYPGRPWYVSVPAMVISCSLALPVFSWLRLASGSVIPAVIGHAFVSTASVSMVKHFAEPDAPLNPLQMSLAGWPGWIAMGALVAFLALTGRLALPAPRSAEGEKAGTTEPGSPDRTPDRTP
ncbi:MULTISPECIES: CPBP family intramembrane glutamic endopeptidase [unclassified Streptomyces]|uniref:CPBP family intramembrane glutamic endopeptidase n=1 Tax=unclassified Streptomyces TaxID=2593676 RepID=UPI00331EBC8F